MDREELLKDINLIGETLEGVDFLGTGPCYLTAEEERRKVLQAYDRLSSFLKDCLLDPTCATCGHPKSNHPYRHPFVAATHQEGE